MGAKQRKATNNANQAFRYTGAAAKNRQTEKRRSSEWRGGAETEQLARNKRLKMLLRINIWSYLAGGSDNDGKPELSLPGIRLQPIAAWNQPPPAPMGQACLLFCRYPHTNPDLVERVLPEQDGSPVKKKKDIAKKKVGIMKDFILLKRSY